MGDEPSRWLIRTTTRGIAISIGELAMDLSGAFCWPTAVQMQKDRRG